MTTLPVFHELMHGLEGLATFEADLVPQRIFFVVISTLRGIGACLNISTGFICHMGFCDMFVQIDFVNEVLSTGIACVSFRSPIHMSLILNQGAGLGLVYSYFVFPQVVLTISLKVTLKLTTSPVAILLVLFHVRFQTLLFVECSFTRVTP